LDEELIGMKLYEVKEKFSVSRNAYDAFIKCINDEIMAVYGNMISIFSKHDNETDLYIYIFIFIFIDPQGKRIPSGYRSLKAIKSACPVTYSSFDCCPDGCQMYADAPDTEPQQQCSVCSKSRYVQSTENQPAARVNVTSISSIISSKLSNPLTRLQMQYRFRRPLSQSGSMKTDIFDGAIYRRLVNNGFFRNDDDVAIGLFIDGFSPFSESTLQGTLVNMVIYNIDPKER
jgi:hypothetical protein